MVLNIEGVELRTARRLQYRRRPRVPNIAYNLCGNPPIRLRTRRKIFREQTRGLHACDAKRPDDL